MLVPTQRTESETRMLVPAQQTESETRMLGPEQQTESQRVRQICWFLQATFGLLLNRTVACHVT